MVYRLCNILRNEPKAIANSMNKNIEPRKLDKVVAEAHRNRDQRENDYRERALEPYPWICGRCSREFTLSGGSSRITSTVAGWNMASSGCVASPVMPSTWSPSVMNAVAFAPVAAHGVWPKAPRC